jgi:NAD(P)-dependent dehydrogenase (short-subunit alcohol dehydrogenase family)
MSSLRDLSDLTNRRALITGATGGLGKVFAETLAELGADLILVDLPKSNFTELSNTLNDKWGICVDCFSVNLEIEDQRKDLISNLKGAFHNLDILINNAAFVSNSDLSGWTVPFEDQSVTTWQKALEVNLTSVFELSQGLLPLLKKGTGSNIINVSSIYGLLGPNWSLYEGTNMGNPAAYSTTKSGLIGLTRWLATTLAPEIRVNAIAPGGIYREQPEIFVNRYSSRTPMGRMADDDDFRGGISYLASDLSKYVTGQVLSIDGGWSIW